MEDGEKGNNNEFSLLIKFLRMLCRRLLQSTQYVSAVVTQFKRFSLRFPHQCARMFVLWEPGKLRLRENLHVVLTVSRVLMEL